MTPRSFRSEDRAALIDLFDASGWKAEAEAFRGAREARGPTVHRWVVEDGGLLGHARLLHDEFEDTELFETELLVRPDARGQGVGRALWEVLAIEARAQGARRLEASVRDDAPVALAFAERRGFEVESHLFESVLDLATFDFAPYGHPEGVRVFSMADVPDDEANRRKLWRLNDFDIDPTNGACRPFERFERDIFEGYWYRPEGQIVAAIGDDWVGLSAVGITGEARGYNMMTGVVPAFRGRGIATALKRTTIEWAHRRGAKEIWTHNDSGNAPMLAINRKLGYRPVPGLFRLRGTL